ncbi:MULTISPECIES: Bax inhibitor-1/YccA family protein [Saccharopolyspora]|uniref:Bax inhibitor-1/YccA family protein n=1 Tax=Saccharopolyspora gregorii TaxID=33914 RepID=A0ABP6S1Q7_9PSEU|nr:MULTISPECIES: Bax inhibitor-1/YccA family protein [unclassified Saccharopolyspora]MCA1185683.1 Bax inhibitor-1/YccA family protein [Saccharopolyspora sp. 6T]MCA1191592.1 Bax inhibitor-1/YccA family protein [Saccharopolyspora sp. 6V]MCA1227432.1 Bax inhibitor-1/YccA family protein [Saccharopolyspora sp. 6M]MCA1280904.1 Bax inhibitor-1/YccA family protein [Saccharopolyspora sp. 7B]
MRTTSNPAFKNLPSNGGYANFNHGQGGFGAPGQAPAAPPQATRPMTIDDVVTKTAITLALTIATGAATYVSGLYALALPAAIIGLVLSLVIIFKKKVSPALVIAYAAVEGVFLGGISYVIGGAVDNFTGGGGSGIIMQAIAGTMGVFAAMLVVYKTGAIRVTPKLTKWIIGAAAGVAILMLLNLVAGFFTAGGLGLRDGGPLAIVFSLVCIGIAAFSFLLDFDAADKAIKSGVDAKFAWYVAFGLMTTLVWLYLEILRLLSYFQND